MDKLIKKCDTPSKLASWISGHIINDGTGGNQTVMELLKSNRGNCVDIANLYYVCLQEMGHNPFLLSIYDNENGHRVCVLHNEYDDSWYYFDSLGIHKTYSFNERGIADFVNMNWDMFAVYKQ